jgi:hypothetical protein
VLRRAMWHDLFAARGAAAWAQAYQQPQGTGSLPPALVALVPLVHAYDHLGDAEAVVPARLDQRGAVARPGPGRAPAVRSQTAGVLWLGHAR